MTIALAAEGIECFRSLVVRCLGLYFEDAKLDMLASVLRQRMKSTGCDLCLAYRQRLTSAASGCEEIGSRGATGGMRSVLFRIDATAASVRRSYDPHRVQARGHQRKLRTPYAGCTSGEEV
jgi:chemotaxis methyl-accepting protein methylase